MSLKISPNQFSEKIKEGIAGNQNVKLKVKRNLALNKTSHLQNMKTLEEIKKFFPNHKFKDDYDLILIQFTAEDLIDFSEEYAKKVAIASLEKASENAKLKTFSTKN